MKTSLILFLLASLEFLFEIYRPTHVVNKSLILASHQGAVLMKNLIMLISFSFQFPAS